MVMEAYRTPIDTLAVYPDYEWWFSKPTWSLGEAAAITIGLNPETVLEERGAFLDGIPKRYSADDDINGDLDSYSIRFGDLYENLEERIEWFMSFYYASDFLLPVNKDRIGFEPWAVIQWCFDNALPFHFTLKDFIEIKGFDFRLSKNSDMLASYRTYVKKDTWSLSVAARLIIGVHPEAGREYLVKRKNYNRHIDPDYSLCKRDEYYEVLELAEESYHQGSLRFINGLHEESKDNLGIRNPEECMVTVNAQEVIRWAISKKFNPPAQLLELMGLKEANEKVKVLATSSYISPYMRLMKEAIDALLITEENMPLKKEIVDWLEKQTLDSGEKLSNREAESLATFIRTPSAKIGGNRKFNKG